MAGDDEKTGRGVGQFIFVLVKVIAVIIMIWFAK